MRTAMAIMHHLIKKDPMGFAGIALYIACSISDEKRTQATNGRKLIRNRMQ